MSLQDSSNNICPPLKALVGNVTTSTGTIEQKTVGTICWGKNTQSVNPSTDYNVAFNKPYYFKENNKNNCCHGQFGWKNKNGKGGLSKSPPPSPNTSQKVFYTKNNRGFIFGDISYPRNQRGRWNLSTSNTKLYPVISIGRANPNCNVINGKCIGYKGTQNAPLTVEKQSGRLFSNTNPNMTKKQIFAYLVKNRKYLNR